jgi:threonine/homoserine/homoserine lactone efflux protein
LAFGLLRWAGAAYLAWLGARLLYSRRRGSAPAASLSAFAATREGLIANLTNPNPLIFM